MKPFILTMQLVLAAVLAGCGGAESSTTLPGADPSPDARYATPQSVVDDAQSKLLRTPPDVMGYLDLIYAETPLQTDILQIERAMHEPAQIANESCHEMFGEWTSVEDPFPPWPADEMTITSDDGSRAQARCTSHDRDTEYHRPGRTETMHLVKIDGRWWISGYSYEYLDEYNAEIVERAKQVFTIQQRRIDSARRFAADVRSGKYEDYYDAFSRRFDDESDQ